MFIIATSPVCLLLPPQFPNADKPHRVKNLDHSIGKPGLKPMFTSLYTRKGALLCSPHHTDSLFTHVLQRRVHIAFLERSPQAHAKFITELGVGELLATAKKTVMTSWMKWSAFGQTNWWSYLTVNLKPCVFCEIFFDFLTGSQSSKFQLLK